MLVKQYIVKEFQTDIFFSLFCVAALFLASFTSFHASYSTFYVWALSLATYGALEFALCNLLTKILLNNIFNIFALSLGTNKSIRYYIFSNITLKIEDILYFTKYFRYFGII